MKTPEAEDRAIQFRFVILPSLLGTPFLRFSRRNISYLGSSGRHIEAETSLDPKPFRAETKLLFLLIRLQVRTRTATVATFYHRYRSICNSPTLSFMLIIDLR